MRKIRIIEHISLDGVIEHDGDYEYGAWTVPYRSPAGAEVVAEIHGESFDLLLGRKTYDIFSNFWPGAGHIPIGSRINAATKHIATHRPESMEWGPLGSLGDNVAEGIRNLKSSDGPDVVVTGSSTLTSLLLDEGLVDEVVLIVYPVLLGRGKRMLSEEFSARELSFVSTKAMETGVLINTYKYVGPLKK